MSLLSTETPLKLALIGAGNRASTVYGPVLPHLGRWVDVVAVCDPVSEHAEALAGRLGARPFASIRELVAAELAEAALVVAPVPLHHSISVFLAQHGIHHEVETSIASTLGQAEDMVVQARRAGIVLRIGENFFRFSTDRIMKAVAASGVIGEVRRILCMYDHTGYHNNSRWIVFHEGAALTARSFAHEMPTAPYNSMPHRHHTSELFHCNVFTFAGERLVVDLAGNIKGNLGRYPRPGYTEVAGARGTVVQEATAQWTGRAEVQRCSDHALHNGGRADEVAPVVEEVVDDVWTRSYVDIAGHHLEYVNEYRVPAANQRAYYGPSVAGHIADFARAVWRARGSRQAAAELEAAGFEYTDQEALAALHMDVGCHESLRRGGVEVDLPVSGDLESEQENEARFRATYGVDPLDVEGMLAYKHPRP